MKTTNCDFEGALKAGYYRLVEGYRLHVRPQIKQTFFGEHNLKEFVQHFSAWELKILVSMDISINRTELPALAQTSPEVVGLPIVEAFQRVGILEHTMGVLSTFQVLAEAEKEPASLRSYLMAHGNPEIVDHNGIIDSAQDFVRLNRSLVELKQGRDFYRVLLAALWLHDIGKLIGQEDHPQLSEALIDNNHDVRNALAKIFSGEEIKRIELLVGRHSALPDSVICRERNLFDVYFSLLTSSRDKGQRDRFIKALLLIAIADIGSYNRLTNRKIRELVATTEYILKLAEKTTCIASPEDLKTEAMNELHWGKSMFNSFTALEETPQEEKEIAAAYHELERLVPSVADRTDFFRRLGRIKLVGLIFNLKRELPGPRLRARLIFWIVTIMGKYTGQVDWIELCYSRFDKIRKPKEIAALISLLEHQPIDEIESRLNLEIDHERKGLFVKFPV